MRQLLPLLLLAATACDPEMEFAEDANRGTKLSPDKPTLNVTDDDCDEDDCYGKDGQEVTMGGGAPTVIPNPFELRGHGSVWIAGDAKKFAVAYSEEGAALFAERGTANTDVIAVFEGLPDGIEIRGVWKADYISNNVFGRSAPVLDELLIGLDDGQYLLSGTQGLVNDSVYKLDSAWEPGWNQVGAGGTSPDIQTPGGGGACTYVGCP